MITPNEANARLTGMEENRWPKYYLKREGVWYKVMSEGQFVTVCNEGSFYSIRTDIDEESVGYIINHPRNKPITREEFEKAYGEAQFHLQKAMTVV